MKSRPAISELLPAIAAGVPGVVLCLMLQPAGGLAVYAVAAVVAVATWLILQPSLRTLPHRDSSWLSVWLTALTLATVATLSGVSWLGPALALAVAALPRPAPSWAVVFLGAPVLGLLALVTEPWTLLALQWNGGSEWAPLAVLAGTLLAGSWAPLYDSQATPGLFRWSGIAVGTTLMVACGAAVAAAAGYHASLGVWLTAAGASAMAPATLWLARPESRGWKLALVVLSVWLSLTTSDSGLVAMWGIVTPFALGVARYLQARTSDDTLLPPFSIGWAGASAVWGAVALIHLGTADLAMLDAIAVAATAVLLYWMWAVPNRSAEGAMA